MALRCCLTRLEIPNSNSVEIVAKKGSVIVASGQMRAYFRSRMIAAGATKEQARKLVKQVPLAVS